MLNELLRGTYRSISLYIADDSQELKQIDSKFVKDLVQSVEIESSFFGKGVGCVIVLNNELIKNSIGKEIDRLTSKNIFRVILIDGDGYKVDKTFVPVDSKMKDSGDKSGDIYKITLVDIYCYYLEQVNFSTQVVSYQGTPFSVLEQLVKDSFKIPDEILRSYHIPTVEVKVKPGKLEFLEDLEPITYKCVKSKAASSNIATLCKRYNFRFYQDLESFNIVEGFDVSKLTPKKAKDNSALFSETTSTSYEFKICDKIKRPLAPKLLDKFKISISKNNGGKSQKTETVDFKDFLKTIELNNNSEELLDTFETREITESSATSGIPSILYDYTEQYIQNNTLAIYCSCTLRDCNPGTVTTVELRPTTGYTEEKFQKDLRFGGNWFILGCTFKCCNFRFVVRLLLGRFDNPKDNSKNLTEVASENRSDTMFKSSKPPIPKRPREMVSNVISTIDSFSKELQNATGSFLEKIGFVNNQMKKLTDQADQRLSALTAPIKQSFTNAVETSEIYNKAQEVISKNRRTLNLVNNIIQERTGVDIQSAVQLSGEIMNIDAIFKDAVLNQVTGVYTTLENKATSVVTNVASAVSQTASAATQVIANIDETCTNIENVDVNLDQALDTVDSVLKAVKTTQQQINNVKVSVEDLKNTVTNIPDFVKIENPLETLKSKRERLLRAVKKS